MRNTNNFSIGNQPVIFAVKCSNLTSYFSVRKVIHWFVCAPAFDKFIMIVIVFSSLAIAAEDPVDEDNPRNYYLSKADYVFTITFACEVCLKVDK